MDLFTIITLIVVLSAGFGYINTRYFKLPQTIGLMTMALIFSMAMLLINFLYPSVFHFAESLIENINFSEVLLDVMLSFLLFAGALHTDISLLNKERRSIALFALFGVLISTMLIATILYLLLPLVGFPLDYIYCLIFGVLISPTDPIAVLSILKKSNVPQKIETNIVGESLFNDGVAVVLFISLLDIYNKGMDNFSIAGSMLLLLQEAGGGLLFGFVLGYVLFRLLKSIDDYETEVIITLAAVMGGYLLARQLHISGPLAMVVAGLFTGSHAKSTAMSATTELYVEKFWELIDVLMNAILFVLIGLRLMVLDYSPGYMLIGLAAIPIVLLARYIAIRLPGLLLGRGGGFDRKTTFLLVWGGLRGGLSIAMALSLARTPEKDLIVFITYVVVIFSILGQGLTVEKIGKKLFR